MKRMFAITVIILLPVSFAFGAQKPVLTASNKLLVEIIRKAKEDEVSAKIDEALILGADINRRDAFGNTVLMTVLYDRWTEKTSCYLISKGADLSVVNMSGETAAHIAARKQQYRALYLIAKRKGPLNTANIYGEKPVDRFLKNGDGATLYHWKAVTGNARSFGKDRRYESARDEQQKTPADYAAMAGNFETYSVLMGKSFDMKRDVGRIRSHISAFIKFKDFHALSYIFRQCGNDFWYEKVRLLDEAVRKDDVETAEFLFREGTPLNTPYSANRPLIYNARSIAMAKLLLSHGAVLNTDSSSQSSLTSAIEKQNISLLQFYLENGASLFTAGKPFLITAAERGNEAILALLAEKGAPTGNYREYTWFGNSCMQSPLRAAAKNMNPEIIRFLWDREIDRGSAGPALAEAVKAGNIVAYSFLKSKGSKYNASDDPEGNTLLHYAASSNNKDSEQMIRLLLSDGAVVNARNSAGQTPLHYAAHYGRAAHVELLVKTGADINIQDYRGDTPLHAAVRGRNSWSGVAEKLIMLGAKCDMINLDGIMPYHIALDSGNVKIVEMIAKFGSGQWNDAVKSHMMIKQIVIEENYDQIGEVIDKIDDSDMRNINGDTLLSVSCSSDYVTVDMVRKLHSKGSDLQSSNPWGFSVLHNAFSGGDIRKIAFVVSQVYGVDITEGREAETIAGLVKVGKVKLKDLWPQNIERRWDLREGSLFSDAMLFGNTEYVRLLLLLGANPNRKDKDGVTPFMASILNRYGKETITQKKINLLSCAIDNGADVNSRNNGGVTALMYACVAGNLSAVRLLLDRGARVNDRDNDGWSALMHACENGKDDIMHELVKHGADVLTRGNDGLNAVTLCAIRGNSQGISFLISRGAKKPDAGMVSRYRFIRMIRLHDEDGALKIAGKISPVDFADKYGMTPLMWAIMEQEFEVIRFLLKRGASVNRKCLVGTTPLMFAVRRCNAALVKQLIDLGADVNASRADGGTALGDALKVYGGDDIIGILCAAGSDRNARYADGMPIFFNCMRGYGSNIASMKSLGFDINIRDSQGRTSLMVAAFRQNDELVGNMTVSGADLNLKDFKGRTALDYAAVGGEPKCVKILHEAGFIPTAMSCAVMGDYYRNDRLYEVSIKWYSQALSLEPDVNVYNGYGISLMRTGKLDDAEKAFLKAVSINPDDSMPYYNLCCLFAKKGNPNAAFLWLDRAIEKGMRDRAFMKQDLDLEPLRDDSRYKAIMSAKRLPVRK